MNIEEKLKHKYHLTDEEVKELIENGYDSPAKIKQAKKNDLPAIGKKIRDTHYGKLKK